MQQVLGQLPHYVCQQFLLSPFSGLQLRQHRIGYGIPVKVRRERVLCTILTRQRALLQRHAREEGNAVFLPVARNTGSLEGAIYVAVMMILDSRDFQPLFSQIEATSLIFAMFGLEPRYDQFCRFG